MLCAVEAEVAHLDGSVQRKDHDGSNLERGMRIATATGSGEHVTHEHRRLGTGPLSCQRLSIAQSTPARLGLLTSSRRIARRAQALEPKELRSIGVAHEQPLGALEENDPSQIGETRILHEQLST